MKQPRIELLNPPFDPELQKTFDRIMPPGVEPLNIFRTVAHNPRVLSRMVNGGLLDQGSISIAERELVILRSCSACEGDYEWEVHAALFGESAGFSTQQITDTRSASANPKLWTEQQLCLIDMVDNLHRQSRIEPALWQRLSSLFNPAQLIELVMLCGLYHAVSFVVNAFEIESEDFASQLSTSAGDS